MATCLTRGGLALGLCAGLVLFAGGCGTPPPVAENKDADSGKEKGQSNEKIQPNEKTGPLPTKISAPDMDCEVCAKKVIAKLNAVSGVARVEPDFEAHTLTITPKPGEHLSPKALWEACVAGGQDPAKLEGPSGAFTSTPAQ
jgi:copper chaperone CopZ